MALHAPGAPADQGPSWPGLAPAWSALDVIAAPAGGRDTATIAARPPPSGVACPTTDTGLLHCPVVVLLRWGAAAMKTSLDHLPEPKRAQLRAITSIFCEGAPNGMLILFGSHARGDWVQDPETGYRSDFDVLFIVETEKQAADLSLWHELERRAREAAGETPVTLIVHDSASSQGWRVQ
jgi:predicted nucleotidyltransferase